MTRVAWIHNTPPKVEGLLPGEFAGGGEMADAGMIGQAPDHLDITRIPAADWETALEFDRIVVAATDQLSDQAMRALAKRSPIVWIHHQQQPSEARATLFAAADPFLCMSEFHAEIESRWTGLRPGWNHGWIDPCDVIPAKKTADALWAARNHPQKGLINARLWAAREGRALTEITNAPRQVVLDAMSIHRAFVFLPKGVDSCPRTLIEAELAGCQIVTNNNCGRRDPGDISEVLFEQPRKFWSAA